MKQSNQLKQIAGILKILVAAFLVSGVLLALLAFILFRFGLSESAANIGVMVIYSISCLVAGLIAGKSKGKRKFVWGLLTGIGYFLLLAVGTLIFKQGFSKEMADIMLTLAICVVSGMVGGMIS